MARNSGARASAENGFTMVELLIAIMIFMVGIVAVAELVPRAIVANFRSRNSSTAIVVAQEMMEKIAAETIGIEFTAPCPVTGETGPADHYWFCDADGAAIATGEKDPGSLLTRVTPAGCPMDGKMLNFDPAVNCPPGYQVEDTIVWDVQSGATQTVEIRWRVWTLHRRSVPVRKVIMVGARVGQPGQGIVVRNLQTIIGR